MLCILLLISFILTIPAASGSRAFTLAHHFRHDYGTVSSALGDLTGDGIYDVVLSTDTGELRAYTLDGFTLWSKELDAPAKNLTVLRRGLESYILFYNDNNNVYLLDSNGDRKWRLWFPQTKPINSVSASDIDGNGVPEIVVGFKDATFAVYTLDGSQWKRDHEFLRFYVLRLYTADHAATEYQSWENYPLHIRVDLSWIFPDVIASGQRDPNIYLYDPTGKMMWNIQNVYPIEHVYSGDINNNGQMEVITASYKYLQAFGLEGRLWQNILDSYIYSFGIGDVTKDGNLEIAAGTVNGRLYLFNSKGNSLWNEPIRVDKDIRYVAVKDFTGDGSPEIFVAAGKWSSSKQEIDDGSFYIFSKEGELLSETRINGPIKTISIADINSNGFNDVIVCSNFVFVFKNNLIDISALRHYEEGERLLLTGQFEASIDEFNNAKELYQRLKDSDAVKRSEKNIQTAVEFKALNQQALEIFDNANIELNRENYQKALDLFTEAKRLFERVGNRGMVQTTDVLISETSGRISPVSPSLPLSPIMIIMPIALVILIVLGGLGFVLIRKRRRI